MTDSLTIALAQLNPTLGDVSGNVAKIRAARVEAAASGADLVVYAELAGHPGEPAHLDTFLDTLDIRLAELTRPAARLAGQAFRQYRRQGGTKTAPGRKAAGGCPPGGGGRSAGCHKRD